MRSRCKEPSRNKAEAYRVYGEHLFRRSDAADALRFAKASGAVRANNMGTWSRMARYRER